MMSFFTKILIILVSAIIAIALLILILNLVLEFYTKDENIKDKNLEEKWNAYYLHLFINEK